MRMIRWLLSLFRREPEPTDLPSHREPELDLRKMGRRT
jgi:hypothetical protein